MGFTWDLYIFLKFFRDYFCQCLKCLTMQPYDVVIAVLVSVGLPHDAGYILQSFEVNVSKMQELDVTMVCQLVDVSDDLMLQDDELVNHAVDLGFHLIAPCYQVGYIESIGGLNLVLVVTDPGDTKSFLPQAFPFLNPLVYLHVQCAYLT